MALSIIRVIGENNYTQVSSQKTYTQEGGETTSKTYEGPIEKINDLYTISVNEVKDGILDSADKGISGGKGQLSITYVADDGDGGETNEEAINEIWELIGQDFIKPLRSYGGEVNKANGDKIDSKKFNEDANQAVFEEVKVYYETGGTDKRVSAPAGEPQETYYKLLLRGQSEYLRSAAILRRTVQTSRRGELSGSWKKVDRAITLAETGFSSSGQGALVGAISEMPEQSKGRKQWLKRAPQITQVGRGRYNLVQEWIYAAGWSTNMYDGDQAP